MKNYQGIQLEETSEQESSNAGNLRDKELMIQGNLHRVTQTSSTP